MIRISVTSKLDGVRSWSLVARDTCPGSIGADGKLVPACVGCYAVGGNYRYPNVKNPRIENREDWKRPKWVAEMVAELRNDRFFRWFDSGDMYALALAEKIYAVMVSTPHVQHWLPTRMHKFQKFADVLARMQSLPNVMVRPSANTLPACTALPSCRQSMPYRPALRCAMPQTMPASAARVVRAIARTSPWSPTWHTAAAWRR
jgi:hypothetical protein